MSSTISLPTNDEASPAHASTPTGVWWRTAVVYQVYPRSFADGNGDGIGDLAGVRERLPYLQSLGVDALWFNPWYPSPMADGGYDVIDYRDIHPDFGTLAEAEALIAEAHAAGIRVIIDVVPNHTSDENPWFRAALAAGPGSPERDRFWFRPGRGEHGELAPNNWDSIFGGPAWTRITEADGTPGEWYLHLFASEQPDFNWDSPDVRREFEEVLRFWFDRGADGIRIDSAALCVKDPSLPDLSTDPDANIPHPFTDLDGVHEVYREWRRIADSYEGNRVLIGEVWLPDPVRFANYLRPDEMHTAFNFDLLSCPWDVAAMHKSIDTTLRFHRPLGAPSTWVLSNHDVTRHVTRYGKEDTSFVFADRKHGAPYDAEKGMRRARAAALLTTALPGSVYVYQGEELGLDEVENLDDNLRQDPMWFRSGHKDPGRDGCRIPLPWTSDSPSLGFSPADATGDPWLPQPERWAAVSAEVQSADPESMLSLYRSAIAIRKDQPALLAEEFTWLDCGTDCLSFNRGAEFAFVLNLGPDPVDLPTHEAVLLTSAPLVDGRLATDTAAWLRVAAK
ncbi:MAG: alpha-glucosidase [Frankiaceae bacterium]|nr:alpha-glucosidase [Frankiaceae bacterium]